jgi:hypothetical protein
LQSLSRLLDEVLHTSNMSPSLPPNLGREKLLRVEKSIINPALELKKLIVLISA